MLNKLKGLVVEEQGQGMTEYGLVLGIIAVAAVAAMVALRAQIIEMFEDVVTLVTGRPS
ncbi:Flp family type IVb pilin [Caldalkalibacillus mannanilyticus]|uniref:Flp family type IVb pilin n=1 Tax=Caldalkalibacillus mannanilyticus TaxID=1418 RepID=UPI00046ADDB0|nr:pilin [Caldalkalibacillus mannanilyticus]